MLEEHLLTFLQVAWEEGPHTPMEQEQEEDHHNHQAEAVTLEEVEELHRHHLQEVVEAVRQEGHRHQDHPQGGSHPKGVEEDKECPPRLSSSQPAMGQATTAR